MTVATVPWDQVLTSRPQLRQRERERDTTIENYRILCGEVERWSLIDILRILREMREILDFDYY